MLNTRRWHRYWILCLALLFVSACGQGLPLGTPTPTLDPLTIEEQNAIASEREPAFANALIASIEVLGVEVQFENQIPHNVFGMKITFTNTSEDSLIIKRPDRFGFGNFGGCDDDVVHQIFKENGELIEMPILQVDCRGNPPSSDEDLVVLEKDQSTSFTYQLIPANMLFGDDQTLVHVLPPGSYFIRATYDNNWVGYMAQSESSEQLFKDLNAWVGEASSVQVPFVVPPYELPTEKITP